MLVSAGALAQPSFDDVVIEARAVRDGIYMLTGSGGNIGLSTGEDGAFLIDDQYAPLHGRIADKVRELSNGHPRFVINTHWHMDHTGSNQGFGQGGAVMIAHDNVRTRLEAGQFMAFMQRQVDPAPVEALPIVTFSDTMTLHQNGQAVRVIHVPSAHTDGDAIVHFTGSNVLHMGDTYFAGMRPFIDGGSGGSLQGMIAAVDIGLALADENTLIIPGHGPLSNKAEMQLYRQFLAGVDTSVNNALAAGQTCAEVVAAKPTADDDDRMGGFLTPDQFVGMVCAMMSVDG